ncbi:MAG: hypothetical protein BI182_16270 [Acetobacterium sp. MES1]|uniref:DUF4391 domain-containing protein n=1 Tax=Acetobacterium sp. MES1 TaxID=1899015 RepID=UPI000B9CB063|nr:DUF4391 domain-containing protein [Acetobacterium sp. MES1]OXS25024.1 MAG: hypothetical protein BI182_16270 [Acetobacterium sp. MES1]
MIDLPGTTNVYKRLPKELFYKYLNDDSASKKIFIDEIRSIIWINTLSPETIAHPTGQNVTEIAIVEIILNRQAISSAILEIINREIDQYAVFLVRYEEWGQLWCCDHQMFNPQTGLFNCQNYHQTNWMSADDLSLKINGMNLDQIYENFFMQIAGKAFPVWSDKSQKKNDELIEKVEQAGKFEQLERLEATIKNLESQMGKEMQFGKQVKLATDLKTTREELQKIKRGMSTHIEIHQPEIVTTQEEKPEGVSAYFPNVYMKMRDNRRNRFDYSLI